MMKLYIGTNYHPHDWEAERWRVDVEYMKQAGVNTVRMGHLCWDSFEPQEGVYTWEWFDAVMDLFAEAGIGVVLDISLRPAPVWVHQLCPGCNVTDKSGITQASVHRYYEDVADEAYQYYAFRFAKIMIKRYKDHPAFMAFGLCNEVGAGKMSYSEYAHQRFIRWLKHKYQTVENLNRAWNTQRWCRRLSSFEEVVLPENELAKGAPESWLDMRRFHSDGLIAFMKKYSSIVRKYAPNARYSTNLYPDAQDLGYDYFKEYEQFMDIPGMGYYPLYDVRADRQQYFINVMKHAVGELEKPLWFLEFQTGTEGITSGPKDFMYMQVMYGLLNRVELALAWTWRTMYGGEEQYYYGVLGHDGLPTQNYEDLKHLSQDFKKLEPYAFPYVPHPAIGVAFSQDSWWMARYHKEQFRQDYADMMIAVQRVFYANNREHNFVNLRKLQREYQLLVIPGHIIMEESVIRTIRSFVEKGGTVIMTGYSALADERGSAFTTIHPGGLADVFGIRRKGLFRTDMPCFWEENAETVEKNGRECERIRVVEGGNTRTQEQKEWWITVDCYEEIELTTARSVAEYKDKGLCAISENGYGKGKAYYIAAETNSELLEWLIERVAEEIDLGETLRLPYGVQGRRIAEGQYFYVNCNRYPVTFALNCPGRGILTEKSYEKTLTLEGYQCELIVSDKA